jgi:hypothetical protein
MRRKVAIPMFWAFINFVKKIVGKVKRQGTQDQRFADIQSTVLYLGMAKDRKAIVT